MSDLEFAYRNAVNRRLKSKQWEHIGDISIDSATLVLGDPVNSGVDVAVADIEVTEECVSVQSGMGDGVYGVYVKWFEGRVAEVRVVFLDPES